jgi:F-type H+-transporting ATPase subunit a
VEEFKLTVSLKAEPIICVGGHKVDAATCSDGTVFAISNSTITTVLFFTIIFVIMWLGARKAKLIPTRWQSVTELLLTFIYDLVESSAGKRVTRVIFPLICTYFLVILFSNWFSLIPGVGSFGFVYDVQDGDKTVKELVPLFRAPNADLNNTFAMAVLAVVIVQAAAIISHGVKGWLLEFVPTRSGMDILLTPIEIVGQFARILSLAFRLFGNVFAGEVLLAVILKISAPALVIFLGLEIFIGAIQALVFALLTLIFLSLVTEGGHSDEGAEHGAEAAHSH